jgi:DNA-binding NarL/FixJ family response regulator
MGIRVFHVDDHAAFSSKLRDILETHVEWVGASTDGDEVVAHVAELAPDVVLLDISLPGKSGFELAREIRETTPAVKIIMVTMHADLLYVETALHVGASGYVLKSSVATEIVGAIERVHRGGTFVSHALARRKTPR